MPGPVGSGGDFGLSHPRKIFNPNSFSVQRVSCGTYSLTEAGSWPDLGAPSQTRPAADLAVITEQAVVGDLNQSADLTVVTDLGQFERGSVDTGRRTDARAVTDLHATDLRDSNVLASIMDVAETATSHHGFTGDLRVLSDLTTLEYDRAGSHEGACTQDDSGADEDKR